MGLTKFDQNQPLVIPRTPNFPISSAEKKTPIYGKEAVGVSIGMSLGIGIVVFVAIVMIASGITGRLLLRPALIVGGIVMFAIAIYAGFEAGWQIIWQTEHIDGAQPPAEIMQPQNSMPRVIVEAQREDGSNSWVLADLPGDQRVIAEWISDACKRESLAVELWEPRFGYTTTKYGTKIPIYTLFKKCLNDRKWIISRGSHGIILSNEGRRVLGNALEQLQVPLLTEGEEDGVV